MNEQTSNNSEVNVVTRPVCLDERHKGVNDDNKNALALAQRLDRYVAGNSKALGTVHVPSPTQEQQRMTRQREQLKGEVKRVAAQGRSLLLSQGCRQKKNWWEEFKGVLPAWLVRRLEVFWRILKTLTEELERATAALEAVAPAVRPKVWVG